LKSRGVSDAQIEGIGIGYFPPEQWPPYLKDSGDEDIQKYLEWSSNGYRMKGKLVFPMRNAAGFLRGIQIRSPSREKKDYSKYYLSRSKVDAIFFGIELAMSHIWKTGEVYLCEGLFDYFPLQRVFTNTICTGTANVSKRQVEFLLRYVEDVNVVFDMDWGGDQFYRRFTEDYGDSFKTVRRIEVRGKDVSEMWEQVGDEGLEKRLTRGLLL